MGWCDKAITGLAVFSRARRFLAVKRLYALSGRSSARSDSEDVAVALVGRTGEEKGGES